MIPSYQKKLSKQTGLTPSTVSEVLRGKRKVSIDAARVLEAATGVDRLAWLYPEEYPNPLIKVKAGTQLITGETGKDYLGNT